MSGDKITVRWEPGWRENARVIWKSIMGGGWASPSLPAGGVGALQVQQMRGTGRQCPRPRGKQEEVENLKEKERRADTGTAEKSFIGRVARVSCC